VRLNGDVRAIQPMGDGTFVVGGSISYYNGTRITEMLRVKSDGTRVAFPVTVSGLVSSMALAGGWLYLGGDFQVVNNRSLPFVARVNATTGAVDPTWRPAPNGDTIDLAVAPGGLVVLGAFSKVGGLPRSYVALIATTGPSSGRALEAWRCDADSQVNSVVVNAGSIYLGGQFKKLNTTVIQYLARVDAATGTVDPSWNPTPQFHVFDLATDGTHLYCAGSFTRIGAGGPAFLTRLTLASGSVDPSWDPKPDGFVTDIAISGDSVYAAGNWLRFGGVAHRWIGRVVKATGVGDPAWVPALDGVVAALAADGSSGVWAGGRIDSGGSGSGFAHFSNAQGATAPSYPGRVEDAGVVKTIQAEPAGGWFVGGTFDTVNGLKRHGLFRLRSDRTLDPTWSAGLVGFYPEVNAMDLIPDALGGAEVQIAGQFEITVNGVRRVNCLRLKTATGAVQTGFNPQPDNAVYAMVRQGSLWVIGGAFDGLGPVAVANLARFDSGGVVDAGWKPTPNGTVRSLLVEGVDLYVGGEFTTFGKAPVFYQAKYLVRVPVMIPDVAWQPQPNDAVFALATDGTSLFVGGRFTKTARAKRRFLAQLPLGGAGTATSWNPNPNGAVYALRHTGPYLYVGGVHTTIANYVWRKLTRFRASDLAIDTTYRSSGDAFGLVSVIEPQADGSLFVGGSFEGWDNDISKRTLVRILEAKASPLPLAATPLSGEPGAAGPAAELAPAPLPPENAGLPAPEAPVNGRTDPQPPNDNFATATVQTGDFWLASGTLHGATSEPNEPVLTYMPNGPTTWWQWTPTRSGSVRLRTWGSERDNLLAVYRGDSLDTLRLLGFATSATGRENSAEIAFSATAGETYHIQVLGADFTDALYISEPFLPGRVQLSLVPYRTGTFVPTNDAFSAATTLSGASAEILVCNTNATSQAGEPLDLPGAGGDSVWVQWTAPAAGVWSLSPRQTDFDNLLSVYTGAALGALTRVNYSDYPLDSLGPDHTNYGAVRFQAIAGQIFWFQLMSNLIGDPDQYGVCRLTLQPALPPPNDDFANSLPLTGSAPTAAGRTTFATREAGEPGSLGDATGSAWWTWTPPTSGLLHLIGYHGAVSPFTGGSLGTLTPLPTDSRNGTRPSTGAGWGSDGSSGWFRATAGVPIVLQAFGDLVSFTLQLLDYLPNDDFAGRTLLTGVTASVTVDLLAASLEPDEPSGEGTIQRSVWYRWTAPATGRFSLDTVGSQNLRRVNVYTGTTLASLTRVSASNYFNAVSGTTYAIQLGAASVFSGPSHLNLRPAPPPANDNFASATVETGSAWSATGTNLDATTETNEPVPAQYGTSPNSSVWWRWTAPATGLFRVSTVGSAIDTVLTLHTGAALGALTLVAEDQSAGWLSTGAVLFNATLGTTYHIRVDGQLNAQGTIELALQPAPTPPNDAFAARLMLSGVTTTATGNLIAATLEAGEPSFSSEGGHSVWFDWTAPASGTAFFRVLGDPFSPAFGLYTGTTLGALVAAVSGGSGAASTTAQTFLISYPVSSGTSYKIRVAGAPVSNGSFELKVSMPAPPLNDAFASRLVLSGAVVRSVTNNEGATAQPGEPAHAGTAAAYSVWHEWTAPTSGKVSLDTIGNSGRPRLAVYTGTALNALTPVASAATTGIETFAKLTFNASAGVTYLIAVDSTSGSRGTVPLNLVSAGAVPANDAFAGAATITTDAAEHLVEWLGVSAEVGEPAHGGRPAARSLWWNWVPLTSRRARLWFETQDASLLARIAVYRGTDLGSLTQIAATTADYPWDRLEADVNAGETYRIVIDSPAVAAIPGWIRWGIAPVNGTADQVYLIAPENGAVAANSTGAFTTNLASSPTARREMWWAWTPDVCARMEWRASASPGSGITLNIARVSSSSSFANSTFASASVPVPGSGDIVKTFDVEPDVTYFLEISMPVAGPVSVQLAEAPRQPPPDNDLEYRAMPMSGASWTLPVTLGAETTNRLWWTWTAPSAGVAEVKLDGPLAETDRLLAYAEDAVAFSAGASRTNGGAPVLRLACNAGTRWRIVSETSLRRLRATTLSLISPATGAPPANDSWTTAQPLAPTWNSAPGDVTLASCQPGEPDHSDSGGTGAATLLPPGRSVWYDWTPSTSGNVSLWLDTTTDLALRVYYGPALTQWQPIQEVLPGQHRLGFFARAGENYHLAVATRPPFETTAPFTLRFGGPPNDLLAGAIVLSGASATSSVNSAGAGTEDGEPGYGFNDETPRASLWWKWTAAAAGSVWIDTRGSEFDTVLTVFGTDPPDTTSRSAENDNLSTQPGVTASAVRFATTAGQTYLIRLCRRDAAEPSGLATLNLAITPPLDPYSRWLAAYPTLTGPDALENADPDHDGLPNLLELALGTSPIAPDSRGGLTPTVTATGWQVEAALDRDALAYGGEGTPLEVIWQTSQDLKNWQAASATYIRRQGALSIERLTLTRDHPSFVRLLVRRAR
jgi:hypothetical protein